MYVAAGQQQAAVVEAADDFLIRQQFAAQKVVRGLRRCLYDDFADLVAVGDAVVVPDFFQEHRVRLESVARYADGGSLAETEGFPLPVAGADEVPDAAFVQQDIRFEAVVAAFFLSGLGIVEFDDSVFVDCFLQGFEVAQPVAEFFILEAFDLHALQKGVFVEVAVYFREEVLDAAKSGEALYVFACQVAEFVFVEAVVTAAFFDEFVFEEVEAFVEVFLQDADADLEFVFQLMDVEAFAVVEPGNDARQAVGKFFVFAAHLCRPW